MQEDLCQVIKSFSTLASSDSQQQFAQGSLAEVVLICNRLEGTLPQGMNDLQTTSYLRDMAANSPADLDTPAVCVWDAEGSSGAASKQQMEQSMRAALFLQRTLPEPLSRELVLEAYQILMEGNITVFMRVLKHCLIRLRLWCHSFIKWVMTIVAKSLHSLQELWMVMDVASSWIGAVSLPIRKTFSIQPQRRCLKKWTQHARGSMRVLQGGQVQPSLPLGCTTI